MDAYDHEPTEQEWAVIGRYLAGRMQAHGLTMNGNASYRFRGGWPKLQGRSVPQAVMRAIVLEDEERKKKDGSKS